MNEQSFDLPVNRPRPLFRLEYPHACELLTVVGGRRVSVFELLHKIPENVLLEAAASLKEVRVPG